MRIKQLKALLDECDNDDYVVMRSPDGFYTIEHLMPDLIISGSEKKYTFLVTMPTVEYTINHQP